MKSTLYAGCSYTHGTGFTNTIDSKHLWVNQLHNTPMFANTKKINDSEPGRSNSNIFSRAVYNITSHNIQHAFVEWTSVPRLEFTVGLETYSTRQVFMPNLVPGDHVLNDITYSKQYISTIQHRLLTLMHDHYEIVKLIEYSNALINLCKMSDTKLHFINGICPWDTNFFNYLPDTLPSEYTEYTKELLNVDNRSDSEIVALYKKMHTEYQSLGGINQEYWVNLYDSVRKTRVDVNDDNLHPGIQSNKNLVSSILANIASA